jgi:hypothetical protein
MTPAEFLAKRFHEIYEQAAPSFGYETRKESAVPWEEVPKNNRNLMIYVCDILLQEMAGRIQKVLEPDYDKE